MYINDNIEYLVWYRDSNSRPLDHQPRPITTGLPRYPVQPGPLFVYFLSLQTIPRYCGLEL